jgi:hypothetical protein
MAVNLSFIGGAGWQFFDDNGVPLAGGKIYTYAAGTTTPLTTYTSRDGLTANTNPIILDAAGRTPQQIWSTEGLLYKYVVRTSTDTLIRTWDNIGGSVVASDLAQDLASTASNVKGDALVGFRQSNASGFLTGSVGGTVNNKLQEIVSVRDFGADPTGVLDCSTAVQAALNALTSGGTLFFPAGNYTFEAGVTVSYANVTIKCDPNAVLTWATLGTNANAVSVAANFFEWSGGVIVGPSVGAYVLNERFISAIGASTSVRLTGLKVYDADISRFGAYGIYAQFVDNIVIKNNYIHNCGYSGATFLSCNHGNFEANVIKTITPGTSTNMYGVSLTHDSSNYSSLPNPGTKLATHPFCWDWYVAGNHVEDINWEGIDCHGGYEINISGNHVYATRQGIACSGSSGAATDYAGWNNAVCFNVVDAANSDGTVSGYENLNYGINLNGGSIVNHQNVVCVGNVVRGHGILGNTSSGAIQAIYIDVGNVANNVIENWGGNAIIAGSSARMNISGNLIMQIAGVAAGAEIGIGLTSVTSEGSSFTITNNVMSANGGTAGLIGCRGISLTTLPYFAGNDFTAATSAAYSLSASFVVVSEGMPVYLVTVNNAGAGETIDISPMRRYNTFQISVTSSNAASVVTNLTNAQSNQIVYLYSPGATAWLFNRSNAALGGGLSYTAAQYGILALRNINNTSTVKWVEISRSANS